MNCPKCGKAISPDDKECRYCGVIIAKVKKQDPPSDTSDTPSKEQTLKKPVEGSEIFIAICVIVAVIYGGYLFETQFMNKEISSSDAINVTAKELYKAYSDDELNANLKYEGKRLLVRGEYRTAFMQFGKPNILLDTDSSLLSIQCVFDNNSKRLANLKKGEEILIKGKCTGKTGNVFIKNCVLQ